MKHLEDILNDAGIEEPLLDKGRWYVTKDAALAGMTAVIEECAKVADSWPRDGAAGSEWDACAKGIAAAIRNQN